MKITSLMVKTYAFRMKGNSIEFILLKRSENDIYPNLWQMVSGRIEEGEKAYDAALRELKEETGLEALRMWVIPNVESFYSHELDSLILIPVFAALVDSESTAKISEEHSGLKWAGIEECKKILAWEQEKKTIDVLCDYYFNKRELLNLTEIKYNI